jgi:hypothetical protein
MGAAFVPSLTTDLADVSATAPATGQVLVYSGSPAKWTATPQSSLAAGALSTAFASDRVLVGQGTGVPATDALLAWDTANHRLGIGGPPSNDLTVRQSTDSQSGGGIAVTRANGTTTTYLIQGGDDFFYNLSTGVGVKFYASGGLALVVGNAGVGFNGASQVARGTITGSRSGNAALANLLTYLASRGDITDNTTA